MDSLHSKAMYGKDLKVDVHVEPVDGVHMADCDFQCEFFVFANRSVYVKKRDMIQVDEDNYTAILTKEDTRKLGRGLLNMTYHVAIPDEDFEDGFRDDGDTICTGITIV